MYRDYMSIAMKITIQEVGSMYNVVRDSWELIQESKSSIEMGALVFDYLFSLVPSVETIFTKSRQEMAIKMGNMLDMIITCAEDPDNMKKQLESLGLRHVLYSVKPHHIPLMGPVLISVLSEQLGADWTPEIDQAWTSLWAVIGEAMAQAIQEGLEYGVQAGKILSEIQERAEPHRVGHLILTALSSSALDLVDTFGKIDSPSLPGHGSKMQRAINVLEHLTGIDIDGDGTTGGVEDPDLAETVGVELWAFVLKAAQLMFEPEKQHELIFVYANRYFRRGMRHRHLAMVGNAIEAVFAIILQGDEWTRDRRRCWVWLWNNISITLGKVICIVCICTVRRYMEWVKGWVFTLQMRWACDHQKTTRMKVLDDS
jgi:hemoglobin-like flavoprotein